MSPACSVWGEELSGGVDEPDLEGAVGEEEELGSPGVGVGRVDGARGVLEHCVRHALTVKGRELGHCGLRHGEGRWWVLLLEERPHPSVSEEASVDCFASSWRSNKVGEDVGVAGISERG